MRYFVFLLMIGCQPAAQRVTLYSAQDREFAEPLLKEFPTPVTTKFDTEANKSVSLSNELIADRERPRADVHWGNEPLAAIRLSRAGVYEPYVSAAAKDFPEWTKHATWQAFATRARVIIVNTTLCPTPPTGMDDFLDPKWKGKIAFAKPLFGTTATHAACLFEALGPDKAKAYFEKLNANGVAQLAGNKRVAVDVADGKYAFGWTDTDDAVIEINAGKPVVIVFPDQAGIGTLFLPNTLAVVKGGPNPDGAQKLIDFLLANEAKLAEGGGFQLPLGPGEANLHAALKRPSDVKRMDVDFERVTDRWDEVQTFLRGLFAQ